MYSDRVEGCLVEAGPDSFLTEKPWALSLCGLNPRKVWLLPPVPTVICRMPFGRSAFPSGLGRESFVGVFVAGEHQVCMCRV